LPVTPLERQQLHSNATVSISDGPWCRDVRVAPSRAADVRAEPTCTPRPHLL